MILNSCFVIGGKFVKCYIAMQQYEYQIQRMKHIIRCPQKEKTGNIPHYFSRMTEIKKGDCIFHYQNGHFVAIGIAKDSVYDTFDYSNATPMFEVPVTYYELQKTLHVRSYWKDIVRLLPNEYSSFQFSGQDNEGYLYPCNTSMATYLLSKIMESNNEERLFEIITNTEAKITAKMRIGHQTFKNKLLDLWDNRCAVCEITLVPLLKASHSKPWKDSDNNERLDPYNGLLLCAHHDALYDKGYITVDRNGIVIISSVLKEDHYKIYNLCEGKRIDIFDANKNYFSWHYSYVFKK